MANMSLDFFRNYRVYALATVSYMGALLFGKEFHHFHLMLASKAAN